MPLVRLLLCAALLTGCLAGTAQATVMPIDSLHYDNMSTGISLAVGRRVTVQGTVTSPDSLFTPTSSNEVFIQDATGGVNVFITGGMAAGFHFGLNDSVEVTGYVKNFNGLTEIDSAAAVDLVTHLGTASIPPTPLVLTCADMNNSFQSGYEPNESRLIRVNGVHLSSGTWPTTHQTVNITLTMTDATGSATLFIDKDSPVNGSPDPGAKFDIIGVLKQFKSAAPYYTGYELQPRYASDVIPGCLGPTYVTVPTVMAVDSLGATITWTTDTPSASYLRYGTSKTYTDSVGDGTLVTNHTLVLAGLSPRTLYHFQAKSVDANGPCYSSDRVLVTWPSPGTPGDISIFFDYSVDTTVARYGVPHAQGNIQIRDKLIALINSAQHSLDCALYSFSITQVTDALIAAAQRGVAVRLVQDAGNSTSEAQRMNFSAGVPYITSTFGGNHSSATGFGIMHSKYVVVDANGPKDSAYVWTGSWNCSFTGQYDYNNTLIIHDYGVAQAYTMDFEQMWGSSTSLANAATSRMGQTKSDIIPHLFLVGGVPLQVYMSPSDQVERRLIQNIQQAQVSQQFCILDFTSDSLSHAMKLHRDSTANFVERGVFDQSSTSDASSDWCKLDGQPSCSDYWIPRADVFKDPVTGSHLLHHKYSILDEGQPTAVVMTGSHNYSKAANTVNDENTVIVHDYAIANVYLQEFWARYKESGGQATIGVEPIATRGRLALLQSMPNPSRGETRILYSLPGSGTTASVSLKIYDPAGRMIRSLVEGPGKAGLHEVRWDGRTGTGQPVATGVYFYRLTLGGQSLTRKLALVH